MTKRHAKRGRPLTGKVKKKRYQICLEPSVAANFRIRGNGNLSGGIAVVVKENAVLAAFNSVCEDALRRIFKGGMS
jgi:hypothetical protein